MRHEGRLSDSVAQVLYNWKVALMSNCNIFSRAPLCRRKWSQPVLFSSRQFRFVFSSGIRISMPRAPPLTTLIQHCLWRRHAQTQTRSRQLISGNSTGNQIIYMAEHASQACQKAMIQYILNKWHFYDEIQFFYYGAINRRNSLLSYNASRPCHH